MTIQVSRLPDEPIITALFEPPMNLHDEIPAMFRQFLELRDTIHHSSVYYVIIDTATSLGNHYTFGDIVYILGEAASASRHKRTGIQPRLMLVGSGPLIELAARAMAQLQYGGHGMRLYTALSDALGTARAELAPVVAM